MKLFAGADRFGLCSGLMLAAALASPSYAAQLDIGDPAPPLQVSGWIKGGPLDLKQLKGSNIVVLDFWATVCLPCRYTLPYLTDLQKTYRDRGVTVIGISSEPAEKIKSFLPKLGAPVGYALAADLNHQTFDAYLKATGWEELPRVFLIDKEGNVAWHGNTTVALDKVLDELISGKFDLAAARRTVTAQRLMREYFMIALAGVDNLRAVELGEQIVTNAAGYPALLNEFAWKILTDRRIRNKDYDLALRASKEAYKLSSNTVPIMDTHARALFETGKKSEAIELEKKAIAACKDPRFKPELESVLLRFERLSGLRPSRLPQ